MVYVVLMNAFSSFKLNEANIIFIRVQVSLHFFLFCPLSPIFLTSISGNLMILLNMWVNFYCLTKINQTLYACVFSTSVFHLLMICYHFCLVAWTNGLFLIGLNYVYTFQFVSGFVKWAWCYWLHKEGHELIIFFVVVVFVFYFCY